MRNLQEQRLLSQWSRCLIMSWKATIWIRWRSSMLCVCFTDMQSRFSSSQSFRSIWKRTKCLLIDVRLFIEDSQICRRFYKQRWTWDIQRISRSRKRTLRMRKNSARRCRVKRKRCWWWVSTIRSLRIKTDRDLVFEIDKQRDDLRSLVRDYLNDRIKLLKLKYQSSKR